MLDSEFFQRILSKNNQNKMKIEKISENDAVPPGNNFVCHVLRVVIQGTENGKDFKKQFIVKRCLEDKEILEKFCLDKIFLNEHVAYCKIIPELQKFSKENLPFPKCFYADDTKIVLEDLSVYGYENVDKRIDFTIEQAFLVVKQLAKIHASSLLFEFHEKSKFSECVNALTEVIYYKENKGVMETQMFSLQVAIYLFKTLKETKENIKALEVLEEICGNFKERLIDLIQGQRPFKVINHGDTWGNNILFKDNKCLLIDLQVMRYASIASDLTYFLYINLKPSVRRSNLDLILDLYMIELENNVKKIDKEFVVPFTKDWLENEMKEFSIMGLTVGLWLLPVFHFKDEDLKFKSEKPDLEEAWGKYSPECRERMKEIVLDFVEYNVL